MVTIFRPERAIFRFSGPEAYRLLNDVLTGPFIPAPGLAGWWALLTPQGKIQAEGLSGFDDGAWWLDVAAEVADNFFKRMKMYRLRADVTIDDLRDTHGVGWTNGEAPAATIAHADPRAIGMGTRLIAERAIAESWGTGSTASAEARHRAGIAELGPDFAADTTFPHDIGMDILGGIDFVKGCYVGQEVVSRMKHRGTARRRPVIVSNIAAPTENTQTGASVQVNGRDTGTIGTPAAGTAVASLRLDRITDPSAATIDDLPVHLSLPDWATYGFGESPSSD